MQFDHLKRGEFITLLIGAAAWPLAARAQQSEIRRIGFLGAATPSVASQWVAAFVQRLKELGWIETRTSRGIRRHQRRSDTRTSMPIRSAGHRRRLAAGSPPRWTGCEPDQWCS
jgi:hypothetical protein